MYIFFVSSLASRNLFKVKKYNVGKHNKMTKEEKLFRERFMVRIFHFFFFLKKHSLGGVISCSLKWCVCTSLLLYSQFYVNVILVLGLHTLVAPLPPRRMPHTINGLTWDVFVKLI